MACTFDWIEIRTPDPDGAVRFYQQVFGWTVTEQETVDGLKVLLFDTGGEPRMQNLRRGGLYQLAPGQVPGIVVYVRVPSIEETLQKVVAARGKIVMAHLPLPGGSAAFIADPAGVMLGLYADAEPTQDDRVTG